MKESKVHWLAKNPPYRDILFFITRNMNRSPRGLRDGGGATRNAHGSGLSEPSPLFSSPCFTLRRSMESKKKKVEREKEERREKRTLSKQEKMRMPNAVEEKERTSCVWERYISRE